MGEEIPGDYKRNTGATAFIDALMVEELNLIHVTVAYNSSVDLEILFRKIGIQGENVHRIICVDNSAREEAEVNENLCCNFNIIPGYQIKYLKTRENLGSACGFAIAMQIAMNEGADWIWLHDQDGYPTKDCISKIKKYLTTGSGIFAPQVIDENNSFLSVFYGNYNKRWILSSLTLKDDLTPVDVAGTAGLIISRKVVEAIGVYDYIHFFVGFEDFDYCLRAKKYGFKIIVIKDSLYFHPNKWTKSKKPDTKKYFKYFGAITNSSEIRRSSSVSYFNINYSEHNFLINLLFSFLKVFIKKLFFGKIRLYSTYKYYFKALHSRYFERYKKITINPDFYF